MSLFDELKGVSESQYATGALYAGLVGLILSDLIPTPADALYFNRERVLRDKWKWGEIKPEAYWESSASNYYLLNVGWWILVGLATIYTKGTAENKIVTMGTLIGGGAVLAVLYTNVKKDKAQLAKESQQIGQPQNTNP
jgi:hypothetical protein